MVTMVELTSEEAFQHCREITIESASNFFWAIATLPPKKRKAVYVVYAFARRCDDIADSEKDGEEKQRLLDDVRENLEKIAGSPPSSFSDEGIYLATSEVIREYDIPLDYFEELLKGVEMDLYTKRYRTFEDLRLYCYRVASVVGLILIEIFGYENNRAKSYAIDFGIGMQLTNIIRDVSEDLRIGRIYLPEEDLEKFDYSERDLKNRVRNSDFRSLMDYEAARTRDYFESGTKLFSLLPRRARSCPAGLYGIYNRLLRRMESSDWDILRGKTGLTTGERLFAVSKQWVKALMG